MIGDTNKGDSDAWLYRLTVEDIPEGWSVFDQPGGVLDQDGIWVPNPHAENVENLPRGYYDKDLAGKADDWIRVNLANEWGFVGDGRPVFPGYSDRVHASESEVPANPHASLLIGIDFGRTPASSLRRMTSSTRSTTPSPFRSCGAVPKIDRGPPFDPYRGRCIGIPNADW